MRSILTALTAVQKWKVSAMNDCNHDWRVISLKKRYKFLVLDDPNMIAKYRYQCKKCGAIKCEKYDGNFLLKMKIKGG